MAMRRTWWTLGLAVALVACAAGGTEDETGTGGNDASAHLDGTSSSSGGSSGGGSGSSSGSGDDASDDDASDDGGGHDHDASMRRDANDMGMDSSSSSGGSSGGSSGSSSGSGGSSGGGSGSSSGGGTPTCAGTLQEDSEALEAASKGHFCSTSGMCSESADCCLSVDLPKLGDVFVCVKK